MRRAVLPVSLIVLFVALTVLVRAVDVAPIGPLGSETGLSSLNAAFRDALGQSRPCYLVTQVLAAAAILAVAAEAVYGIVLLVKRRSLRAVDRSIVALGIVYAVMAALYLLFERFPVNFRPVLEEGNLAASYPSSHTLLILTVFGTGIFLASERMRSLRARRAVQAVLVLLMLTATVCRLLSGVHWLTDILGGVLLSLALVSAYASFGFRRTEP